MWALEVVGPRGERVSVLPIADICVSWTCEMCDRHKLGPQDPDQVFVEYLTLQTFEYFRLREDELGSRWNCSSVAAM